MNAQNLGIVFGPTLLWQKDADPMSAMVTNNKTAEILEYIIENVNELFSNDAHITNSWIQDSKGIIPKMDIGMQSSPQILIPSSSFSVHSSPVAINENKSPSDWPKDERTNVFKKNKSHTRAYSLPSNAIKDIIIEGDRKLDLELSYLVPLNGLESSNMKLEQSIIETKRREENRESPPKRKSQELLDKTLEELELNEQSNACYEKLDETFDNLEAKLEDKRDDLSEETIEEKKQEIIQKKTEKIIEERNEEKNEAIIEKAEKNIPQEVNNVLKERKEEIEATTQEEIKKKLIINTTLEEQNDSSNDIDETPLPKAEEIKKEIMNETSSEQTIVIDNKVSLTQELQMIEERKEEKVGQPEQTSPSSISKEEDVEIVITQQSEPKEIVNGMERKLETETTLTNGNVEIIKSELPLESEVISEDKKLSLNLLEEAEVKDIPMDEETNTITNINNDIENSQQVKKIQRKY